MISRSLKKTDLPTHERLLDFVDKETTVETKEPSLEVTGLSISQGPPNLPDAELPSGRPAGAQLLRQWYVDSIVDKYALHIAV